MCLCGFPCGFHAYIVKSFICDFIVHGPSICKIILIEKMAKKLKLLEMKETMQMQHRRGSIIEF